VGSINDVSANEGKAEAKRCIHRFRLMAPMKIGSQRERRRSGVDHWLTSYFDYRITITFSLLQGKQGDRKPVSVEPTPDGPNRNLNAFA